MPSLKDWLLALVIGAIVGCLIAAAIIIYFPTDVAPIQLVQGDVVGVYFSPDGGCEAQVLYWIGRANTSIHVLIYSFTLDSIGEALVEAHDRGLDVKVVFEKSQVSQYSEYWRLSDAGVQVRNDTNSRFMHNKIMIVDDAIVLTGSLNYSESGINRNDENLIVIKSGDVASLYANEFNRVWEQGE